MECAVREFLSCVSRFLSKANSDAGSSGCNQLSAAAGQLLHQLQQLLERYPALRPPPAGHGHQASAAPSSNVHTPVDYEDPVNTFAHSGVYEDATQADIYDDNIGGSQTSTEPRTAADSTASAFPTDSFYEETFNMLNSNETEYAQTSQDDQVADRLPVSLVPPPLPNRLPPLPNRLPSSVVGAMTSSSSSPTLSMCGSETELRTPGDTKVPSVTGSDDTDSGEGSMFEARPAVQMRNVASRWGKLDLRQNSRMFPYRRFWGGLVGRRLLLYQKDTDPAHRLSVSLERYEVRRPPVGADIKEKHRPLCFELVKPGGKTYVLLALTPKDARQWMVALERAAAEEEDAPEPQPSGRAPAPVPVPVSVPVPTPVPEHSGSDDNVIEEDVYNVPDDDASIFEDVPLPAGAIKADAFDDGSDEPLYDVIGFQSRDMALTKDDRLMEKPLLQVNESAPPPPPCQLLPPPVPQRVLGRTQHGRRLPSVPMSSSPPSPIIVDEIYDEPNRPDMPQLTSDPIYNVLEPEPEQPRSLYDSPVGAKSSSLRTPLPAEAVGDEAADEGFCNSSGGSMDDENHYKTVPHARPVCAAQPVKLTPAAVDREKLSPAGTTAGQGTDERRLEKSAGGSVRDAIARFNRHSVGESAPDGGCVSPPPAHVSEDMARKQAAVASTIKHLSAACPSVNTPGKQAAQPSVNTPGKQAAQPSVNTPGKQAAQPPVKTPGKQAAQPSVKTPGKQAAQPPVKAPAKQASQPSRPPLLTPKPTITNEHGYHRSPALPRGTDTFANDDRAIPIGGKPAVGGGGGGARTPNRSGLYTVMRRSAQVEPAQQAQQQHLEPDEDIYSEIDGH